MRVAVFVDAGYVYTQCSLLIPGSDTKKSREGTVIRAKEIVDQLTKFLAMLSIRVPGDSGVKRSWLTVPLEREFHEGVVWLKVCNG